MKTIERLAQLAFVFVISCPVIARAQVPAPRDVFGFEPGTDYKLANHQQIVAYFQALDAASDRVLVEEIGKSTLGRPMILALISSEENLRNRERLKEVSRRLALARDLDEGEARRLSREGRVVVWIDGGLHASEVAHAQHTPELGHWLATSESDEAQLIREQALLLLMPVMNPDGLDLVTEWYKKNLGTPFETAPLAELYHHYIGHDNNRDWYMFTQAETKAVANQLYHQWFPQIVYNHHQSSPFPGRIWGPPFENPVNPNLDPLVVSSINQIGEAMRKRFDEEAKPGYNSGIVFDMWWNGSMRGAPDFHNMLGFLTETAGYRYATPHCYDPKEIPASFGERASNLDALNPSTNYTNPWRGGCWPLRSAVDYMLTASRAVLDIAAKLKADYLYNIYRMGRRQIARGEKAEGGPFAYLIDVAAQHDPGAAVALLRVFRQGGIEIRQSDAAFRAGGREFPAGTYVIPPQAFRPFVVDLMEPKQYPDRRQYPGGPPEPPYDTTGYELSLQMGVKPERIKESFPLPAREVTEIPPPAGRVSGEGASGYLLSPAPNAAALAVNRLLAGGARVSRAAEPFAAAGERFPAGTFVIQGAGRTQLEGLAKELGLAFQGLAAAPGVPLEPLAAPRVGLYKSYVANMPEGWTRWLLTSYQFNFKNLSDADVRRGDLSGFDIIVLPDQSAEQILSGHAPGTMPPEYVGGLGVEGALSLKRWVERGGWLLAFDQSSDFAIAQLGLPLRNVVAGLRPQEFFIPGSLVRIRTRPTNPLAYGMPEEAIAFFVGSQSFSVIPPASEGGKKAEREVEVFAEYPREAPLASGWAHGAERYLAGRIAGARVPLGQGQVVLLGFSPHFRGQPHNTYKLLFNPLYASTVKKAQTPRKPTSGSR
jgi:hypothetical protein